MHLEKDLMKQISHRLDLYKGMGQVEWWARLQSGKVKNIYSNTWIRLCDKGTPDYIALIRNKQEGITVLFIEAKSDTGYLRKEQLRFIDKHSKKDILVLVVKDIKHLNDMIDMIAKDVTKEMAEWNLKSQ